MTGAATSPPWRRGVEHGWLDRGGRSAGLGLRLGLLLQCQAQGPDQGGIETAILLPGHLAPLIKQALGTAQGNQLPPNTGVFWAELSGALRAPALHRADPGTSRPGYKLPLAIQGRPHYRLAEDTAINRTYFTRERVASLNHLYVVKERVAVDSQGSVLCSKKVYLVFCTLCEEEKAVAFGNLSFLTSQRVRLTPHRSGWSIQKGQSGEVCIFLGGRTSRAWTRIPITKWIEVSNTRYFDRIKERRIFHHQPCNTRGLILQQCRHAMMRGPAHSEVHALTDREDRALGIQHERDGSTCR